MVKRKWTPYILLSVILVTCFPRPAAAYVGPGTGLSAVGAFLALVAGIFAAVAGFLWYPIKRILGKKKRREPDQIKDREI